MFNGHLQTIFPSIFRKVNIKNLIRERIITPDNDFLDLDWAETGSKDLVIISHGLEGNSQRPYVRGMMKAFHDIGYSALAWNFRGCSGESNKALRFYHSGATDDLAIVVEHALQSRSYQNVLLIGFSLGGNLTLKYLGENTRQVPEQIQAGIAVSVPLNLYSCSLELEKRYNIIYNKRFLKSLVSKIEQKSLFMPDKLDISHCRRVRTLMEFDDAYTAPLHGFANALEYYRLNSSLNFIADIKVPTLILNAKNDPFLAEDCYPENLLKHHPVVYLETPSDGGHCGFLLKNHENLYYSEKRAVEFALVHKK